jgi:L,D-transpeptidase YbiS
LNPQSALLATLALAASLIAIPSTAQPLTADAKTTPCHWWQFHHCDEKLVEGLPEEASRTGVVITIDVATNTAYLFRDGDLLSKSAAATGTEKLLKKGRRIWLFHTPRGHLRVLRKIENPVWRKPDWAFIEDGAPIPSPDDPSRLVKGHLGKYALDLGDGIMIHGTDDRASIGKPASHGCIRLPNDMLTKVWNTAAVGTDVYIFESRPVQTAVNQRERHSDLDF